MSTYSGPGPQIWSVKPFGRILHPSSIYNFFLILRLKFTFEGNNLFETPARLNRVKTSDRTNLQLNLLHNGRVTLSVLACSASFSKSFFKNSLVLLKGGLGKNL